MRKIPALLSMVACLAVFPAAADTITWTGSIAPGVYGRVEFGNGPPPPVVYADPVIVVQPPRRVAPPPPIYLSVPPGHAKHWSKHCAQYHACDRPVYFVRSDEYEPRGKGHGKGKGRGHD